MASTVQPGAKDVEARKLLASLLGRAEFSDLTIKCGREQWHVHKVIVAYHSNILARASGNVVALNGHLAEAISATVQYMYGFSYEDTESTLTGISLHLHVLDLAIKHNMSGLAKHATSKFEERMSNGYSSVSFAELVPELYRPKCRWSSEVRDMVIAVASKNAATLYKEARGLKFRHIVAQTPQSASNMAEELATGRRASRAAPAEKRTPTSMCAMLQCHGRGLTVWADYLCELWRDPMSRMRYFYRAQCHGQWWPYLSWMQR